MGTGGLQKQIRVCRGDPLPTRSETCVARPDFCNYKSIWAAYRRGEILNGGRGVCAVPKRARRASRAQSIEYLLKGSSPSKGMVLLELKKTKIQISRKRKWPNVGTGREPPKTIPPRPQELNLSSSPIGSFAMNALPSSAIGTPFTTALSPQESIPTTFIKVCMNMQGRGPKSKPHFKSAHSVQKTTTKTCNK